jgi:hypothetical protein
MESVQNTADRQRAVGLTGRFYGSQRPAVVHPREVMADPVAHSLANAPVDTGVNPLAMPGGRGMTMFPQTIAQPAPR